MTEGDERPDKYELGAFLGGSFFHQVDKGLGTKHHSGGAAGFRVTENFWRYIGLEQAFTYSSNNVSFLKPAAAGQPNFSFGNRIYQYSLNPIIYFTPRGSKIRPFVTAGISALNYNPTDTGTANARLITNAPFGARNLDDDLKPGLNYGGGLKWHLTDHFGLRFDVRGISSKNPTYRIPDYSTTGVYIPRDSMLNGVQTTAGLTYYIGKKAEPMPEAPKPQPKPLADLIGGSLSAGSGTLCQGRAITVRSNASDPAGRGLTYKWRVNDQPAGSSSPELSFTPDKAGSYLVTLDVESANTEGMPVRTAKASTLSLNVQEYKVPTITSIQANPATLLYGATSALSAVATGSACSTINLLWTATEGTIASPTSMTTSFDSKAVRFEQGGKIQSKTITVTAKVTDDRGQSASSSTSVKVDYVPQAIRFSDIIFNKNGARINNCGKRVLLEELAPKAADPDYEIVLVGHIDQDEVSKTKKPSTLDQQRVKNAVAVLTGGSGTCSTVDVSRIKADWTGTEQVSDMQPGLCGTSTRAASKERSTSVVSTADQNRRVEVWLVPKGTKLPSSFKAPKELSAKELKKLGCPK
jgi:opacity protein-like surface antigen/flagellar motor protein MotB